MPFWVQRCGTDLSEQSFASSNSEQDCTNNARVSNGEVGQKSYQSSCDLPLSEDKGQSVHCRYQRIDTHDRCIAVEQVGDTEHRFVGQEHLARPRFVDADSDHEWLRRARLSAHTCGDEWLDGVSSATHSYHNPRIDSHRRACAARGDSGVGAVEGVGQELNGQRRLSSDDAARDTAIQVGIGRTIDSTHRQAHYIYCFDEDRGVDLERTTSLAAQQGVSKLAGSLFGRRAQESAARAAPLRAQWQIGAHSDATRDILSREQRYRNYSEEAYSHQGQSAIHLDGGADPPSSQRAQVRQSTVKVADRVRVLELKQAQSQPALRKSIASDGAGPPELLGKSGDGNTPLVFPLHVKKFVRRQGNGSPLRAETPLYRSDPDGDSVIHSPLPQRTIPPIKTPKSPVAAAGPPASPGMLAVERSREGWSEDKTLAVSRVRPNPFMHLHGTRGHCVRHGRKLGQSRSEFKGTKDMFEKGRSGAYIPTGLLVRRQMEATSPWRFATGKKLTKNAEAERKSPSDACPDCITELGIQKSEISRATVTTIRQKVMEQQQSTVVTNPQNAVVRAAEPQPPSDMITPNRAATNAPTQLRQESAVLVSTNQTLNTHGASAESEAGELITAADLGAGLDAVILERGGRLERVIMNTRHGAPDAEAMNKLSKELALVSKAIASAQLSDARPAIEASNRTNNDRAMVVDTQRTREHSVPDLLSMIDEAAGGLNVGISRARRDSGPSSAASFTANEYGRERSQSLLTPDTVKMICDGSSTPLISQGSRAANRQRLDEDFAAARFNVPTSTDSKDQGPVPDSHPTDRTVHWSTSRVSPLEGVPSPQINSPPPLKHHDTDLSRAPSSSIPIQFKIDQSTPTLRPASSGPAPDGDSLPTTPLLSPALFTPSTCASTPDLSPTIDKPDTPYPQTTSTSGPRSPTTTSGPWPTLPSLARADTQVIRAAMRMERNKTAQEAAATERAVRKQRQVSAQARRALS